MGSCMINNVTKAKWCFKLMLRIKDILLSRRIYFRIIYV